MQGQGRHGAFPRSSKWLRIAAASGLTIALPFASFFLAKFAATRSRQPAAASAATFQQPFRFASRQVAGNVEFSWDPSSDEVRRAEHGHLTITSGPTERQFWLSKPELETGRYLYAPTSTLISARMELYSFIEKHELASIVAAQPTIAVPEGGGVSRPRGARANGRSETRVAQELIRLPNPIAIASSSVVIAPSSPSRVEHRNQKMTSDAIEKPRPAALPEPPPLAIPVIATVPEVLDRQPRIPPRQLDISFRLEPVAPSVVWQTIDRIPLVRSIGHGRRDADNGFVPARVIDRILPVVPSNVGEFDNQVTVTCLVHVDRVGNVSRIKTLEGYEDLANAAAAAVSSWRFEPARVRGRVVESEMRVEFTFRYLG